MSMLRTALSIFISTWIFAGSIEVGATQFVNPWGQKVGTLVISPVNAELTKGFNENNGDYHKILIPLGIGQEVLALSFDTELVRVDTDLKVVDFPLPANQFPNIVRTVWLDGNTGAYIGFDGDQTGIRGTPLVRVFNRGADLFLSPGSLSQQDMIIIEAPDYLDPYAPPYNFGFGYVDSRCQNVFPFATGSNAISEIQLTRQGVLLKKNYLIGRRRPDLCLCPEDCTRDHIDHYYLHFTMDTSKNPSVVRGTLQRFGRESGFEHTLSVRKLLDSQFVIEDELSGIRKGTLKRYIANQAVVDHLNEVLALMGEGMSNGIVNVPLYIFDDTPGQISQEVYEGIRISDLLIQCGDPHDLDCDGDVDLDDVKIILDARGPAKVMNDPRDLDGDKKITVMDARKLVLYCTRPQCATQ